MRDIIIYTLSDKSGAKYVGKTISLENRLYRHLYDAKTKSKLNKRDAWLKGLISRGENPIIEVLDIVTEDDWIFWEKYWIEQFKVWGFKLKNMTNGGEGTYGRIVSEETKRKMSKSKLGKTPKNLSLLISSRVKKVYQYGLDGVLLKEWKSMNDAKRELSINNINMVANGKRCTAGGYIWRYSDNPLDEITLSEIKLKLLKQQPKSVLQLTKTGDIIKEWGSVNEIKKKYKHINAVLRGDRKSAGGYLWEYKNEFKGS